MYKYFDIQSALNAVTRDGLELEFVHPDTLNDEICLAAVQQNGYALKFVKNQTDAICLAAVQQNGYYIDDVHNQTEAICLAAVKKDGCALEYVTNQTEAICLAAVQNFGWALKYVKNRTEEICLAAVQQFGLALKFVPENYRTDKICMAAVQESGDALKFVKNQTGEICLAAVLHDKNAIQYINDDNLRYLVLRNMMFKTFIIDIERDCNICGETCKNYIHLGCHETHTMCKSCFDDWYISGNRTENPTCVYCREKISFDQCKHYKFADHK